METHPGSSSRRQAQRQQEALGHNRRPSSRQELQRPSQAPPAHENKPTFPSRPRPQRIPPRIPPPLLLPFNLLIPAGLFIYGFSAPHQLHWTIPNLGTCIFAIGLIVSLNYCAQAYVVDTYTTYAASATGVAAFVRTMAGFSFPLFAPRMYNVLAHPVGERFAWVCEFGAAGRCCCAGGALEVGWVVEGGRVVIVRIDGRVVVTLLRCGCDLA